jgi:hypothetical protein
MIGLLNLSDDDIHLQWIINTIDREDRGSCVFVMLDPQEEDAIIEGMWMDSICISH